MTFLTPTSALTDTLKMIDKHKPNPNSFHAPLERFGVRREHVPRDSKNPSSI